MEINRITKSIFIIFCVSAMAFLSSAALAESESGGSDRSDTPLEERLQKEISINFRNTPIEDVLRAMAEQANVDILQSPQVTGNVSAVLTDVPLEEALSNILSAHGYSYVKSRNMIRVAPVDEITQAPERKISQIYRIKYADVREVESALSRFITSRGSISSNPGTSNIIVTDIESKIEAIDSFIEEIDRQTPQVLVEVRIYDITSTDRLDIGVQWQAGTRTIFDDDGDPDPDSSTDPFTKGAFGGAGTDATTRGDLRFGWLTGSVDIDAVLRAQKDTIDAQLLANPRILVLDNEPAEIQIIEELPYQELTESSQGGSIGTTSFKDVGVELKVTPNIARDDMVRLYLQPEFSVETGSVRFEGSQVSYPQPIVDRRRASTTLLVRDGNTVVLGGLRKRDITKHMNKVPLLGDLPLLGGLFRHNSESAVTSELVVFITPRIIHEPVLTETELEQLEATNFPSLDRWKPEVSE